MTHSSNDLQNRMRSGLGKFGGRLSVLLIGLGLLLIGLAYDGASEQTFVQGQIPYLISGGLVGIAFVGIGTALMVMQAYREERMRLESKLDELIVAVQRGGGLVPSSVLASAGLAPAAVASGHVSTVRVPSAGAATETLPTGPAAVAPGDLAGLVVAGSASYHVPGCRLVDGREEVEYLTRDEARARYLQPCRVCKPEPSEAPV